MPKLGRAVLVVLTGLALVTGLDAGAKAAPPVPRSASDSVVRQPVTFVDSFDDGRLTGWTHHDEAGTVGGPSRWRVSGNRVLQTSEVHGGSAAASAPGKPGTLLVAGDPTWTSYDYAVRLSSRDDDGMGVVFRYRDPDNYYRFSMDHQRRFRRLVKKVDGKVTVLAEVRSGYQPRKSYRVRVRAIGPDLRVLLNGRTVLRARDASLPQGQVGLYTWASSSTSFDDVSVQAQSDFFTVAVVPDTQFASANRPSILASQTRWLAANRATQRISTVLQEGDVVNTMRSRKQWDTARRFYDYLDGKVPFVVAAGNHDIEHLGATRPYTKHPEAFNRFVASFDDYGVDGRFRRGDYRNTYHLFTAGGTDMMVLNLDFGPEDDVLAWAGRVADHYPHRHILLLTHDYLATDGTWRGVNDPDDKTLPHNHNPAFNDGVQMWEKFVRKHPNVQFTLNGHVIQTVSEQQPWSVARLVSDDDAGRPVYQVLTNFQTLRPSGGGYLRLFRFYPAQHRVEVRTYSPYYDRYLTDDGNQFAFDGVDLGPW